MPRGLVCLQLGEVGFDCEKRVRFIREAGVMVARRDPSAMRPLAFFKDSRLARMSDGHYCLLRNLGPVKGAKGMKHHEVVIDFSRPGLLVAFRRLISRKKPADQR